MLTSQPQHSSTDSAAWYDTNAAKQAALYEALDPAILLCDVLCLALESRSAGTSLKVLDVGSGSGRDAAWLSRQGHHVVAVEPCRALRLQARQRHPHARVCWVDGALPYLEPIASSGQAFDLILVSAVWQHVAPQDQQQAMLSLRRLLRPGGMLSLLLRHGSASVERHMHQISAEDTGTLGFELGLLCRAVETLPDELKRQDVSWSRITMHSPATAPAPVLRPAP